jgi:hypothetical protein
VDGLESTLGDAEVSTNVQAGMLAIVVRGPGAGSIQKATGIFGRIVYVERAYVRGETIHAVEGFSVKSNIAYDLPVWMVSAKESLPFTLLNGDPTTYHTYERPVKDSNLRPLLDPNLGVTDDEVKELYSTKEKECHSQ